MTQPQLTYVKIGDEITKQLPYSEVCTYMRVAGCTRRVVITRNEMAQIFDPKGYPMGGAVTLGEAGFYRDGEGRIYYY